MRPPTSYPNGFKLHSTLSGSLYHPPDGANSRVVDLVNGLVLLSGGGLAEPSTNSVIFGADNKVTSAGPNKLTFKLTASSGLFKATLTQTGTTERVNFAGAVLQKSREGSGYFLRLNQSGRVAFEAE